MNGENGDLSGENANFFEVILDSLSGLADVFTIVASGIAIYIFLTKRRAITSVFRLLLKYGYQITLSELRSKLDRITDLRVADETQKEQIINIMSEVLGQIRGNPRLRSWFEEELQSVERFVSEKQSHSEPEKRTIVAQLREKLRQLEMESIDSSSGEEQ